MLLYNQAPYLKKVVEQTGYKDIRSLLFLHLLARKIQPKCILELGTGFGCSTIFMALALVNISQVVSIDDYRGDMTTDPDLVQRNIDACGASKQVRLVKGLSTEMPMDLVSPEIVFMDASHDNENLIKEYWALRGFLPKNHIIVVDDSRSPIAEFLFQMAAKYEYSASNSFHNGMAIFATSMVEYAGIITDSMLGAKING